eukprot:TRINITY_DN7002_c0_g1_i4.p1 TRINITY_DN7002_c0_g1~~TRINITY_DN7002_c0_g1_i4.p1  ORF type:complete len:204 (-),score=63.85 TRINITY_DN7002_c0_g1_i4:128-739(-)
MGNVRLPRDLRVRKMPGVMTQCVLELPGVDCEAVTVRLHLFPEMAETYVHNHKNNFASYCVFGSYVHTTWTVVEGGGHYQWRRLLGGEISEAVQRAGSLCPGHSFTHAAGAVYFINRQAFHTVGETGSTATGGQCLSLFIKGKDTHAAECSEVLAETEQLPELNTQHDYELEDEEKEAALLQMESLLRMAAVESINEELHALN